MRVPLVLAALLLPFLLLPGCADPSVRTPDAMAEPDADPFASLGEPWLVWREGCGRCPEGTLLSAIAVTADGRALWWSFEPGLGPPSENSTLEMPPDAAHLGPAVGAVQAHLAAAQSVVLHWNVREAFVADLGGWTDLRRALAEAEAAARLHGAPAPAECHDCPHETVVLWSEAPQYVSAGHPRDGWSDLSLRLGDLAAALGSHGEAP